MRQPNTVRRETASSTPSFAVHHGESVGTCCAPQTFIQLKFCSKHQKRKKSEVVNYIPHIKIKWVQRVKIQVASRTGPGPWVVS
ncbi:uncharacterized protein BJ212DRAFT_1324655 [Suillus subaureus]|uniref:Uncharacterized protein n=1 Tax=Suillus subaureus TaxID=48587 RepID=A0A9P7JI47_9AGAM|nr:uncharacterized protein BJ212DRAFT_1324655 [Suillus subaureus]KAG1823501.1 hypothetical protein BJ212DRAFT_1324655 [Suillus subaureus]